jgi:hypothetical protein
MIRIIFLVAPEARPEDSAEGAARRWPGGSAGGAARR